MKKIILTIILTIFMITPLSIKTIFAYSLNDNTVLRLSALKKDGNIETIKEYQNFENGWNDAMNLAINSKEMNEKKYDRIIVDFYANWNAVNGEFTSDFFNGAGFNWDAIYFQPNVKMTINLNNYTINRGLTEYQYNGEVMYIDENADIIINDGTISGGFSCNGAGGIHINDGANVTLNNVNVIGNSVEDDDGAGIAVYDDANLSMNGGSVSNNNSYSTFPSVYGGGVYIEDATAFFSGVTFQNNNSIKFGAHGAAIYVNNGTLNMENCQIVDNGLYGNYNDKNYIGAYSIINISNGSDVNIKDTKFLRNGFAHEALVKLNTYKYSNIISITASYLTMNNCTFTGNEQVFLIESNASILNVSDCDFTNNNSFVFYGNCANITDSIFKNCQFSYGKSMFNLNSTFYFNVSNPNISFVDCVLNDATFNNKKNLIFINNNKNTTYHLASMFGENSLPMGIALISLVISILSISISVILNKKKSVDTLIEPNE